MSEHARSPSRSRMSAEYVHPATILPDSLPDEEHNAIYSPPPHEPQTISLDDTETPSLDPHDAEIERRATLPFWKRSSYIWVLALLPFGAAVMAATIAPRVEIYTALVCAVHRPELFKQSYSHDMQSSLGFPVDTRTIHDSFPSDHKTCQSDPLVQAETAKLNAVITSVMGVLSFLTTAWWGSFSDRFGRVRLLGISIIGLLLTDANFILVYYKFRSLPGGYWFLLVTAVFEGLVGGLPASIAGFHSYIADVTNPVNRNRIFSLSSGFLFIGMAIGPIIGGAIVQSTGLTISIFYVASAFHVWFALVMWTILPESLSRARMTDARQKHAVFLRLQAEKQKSESPRERFLSYFARFFGFLHVLLEVFSPNVSDPNLHPLKRKMDWNLPLLAVGYGFIVMLMGSYPYKIQFAGSVFHWDSQMYGNWLSLVSVGRVISLLAILPCLIYLFKPKPITIQVPVETDREPLLAESSSPSTPRTRPKEIYSPTFELHVARAAVMVDIIAYAFMSFIVHPIVFTVFSFVGAFSAAFNPAIQTVALDLHVSRTQSHVDTGKLFGALSVVQALCSQVIGPALFGLVYAKSVLAGFPRGIFVLATGLVTITFISTLFIRLPKHNELSPDADEEAAPILVPEEPDQDESLVDLSSPRGST